MFPHPYLHTQLCEEILGAVPSSYFIALSCYTKQIMFSLPTEDHANVALLSDAFCWSVWASMVSQLQSEEWL